MTVSQKKVMNCPKCQAEVDHVSYGGIDFEECPNCHGMFLDFHETNSDPLAKIRVGLKPRKDAKEIDHIEVQCPKCNVKMDKKEHGAPGSLLLDVCPSCRGIWFDVGEFVKYSGIVTKHLMAPSPFKMWYECETCKITRDFRVPKRDKHAPHCPRCNNSMKFQSIRVGQFGWRKDLKGIALYTFPVLALFVVLYLVMGSVFQAVLITLLGSFVLWAALTLAQKFGNA